MQRGGDHVDALLVLAVGVRGLEILVTRRVVEGTDDGCMHRLRHLSACSWWQELM
jgi:hypothetical protein